MTPLVTQCLAPGHAREHPGARAPVDARARARSQKQARSWAVCPGAISHEVGRHCCPFAHCALSMQVFTHSLFGPAGIDPSAQVPLAADEDAADTGGTTDEDAADAVGTVTAGWVAGAGVEPPQASRPSAREETRASWFTGASLLHRAGGR